MILHEENGMQFVLAFSNEIDQKFADDFLFVSNNVFGRNSMMDDIFFKRKFIDNIYGTSTLVVVYSDNKPVGARSFWRNDIDGIKAYQPGSTAVIKEFRGRGIFRIMTNLALNYIDENSLVYNFPNENSYPQYIKLGWKDHCYYYKTIFTSIKKFKEEHPFVIDDEYLKWWILPKDNIYCVVLEGKAFIVKKKKLNIYFLIGEINLSQKNLFKELNLILPLPKIFYYYGKQSFYNKNWRPTKVVFRANGENKLGQIPFYKLDAI